MSKMNKNYTKRQNKISTILTQIKIKKVEYKNKLPACKVNVKNK